MKWAGHVARMGEGRDARGLGGYLNRRGSVHGEVAGCFEYGDELLDSTKC